MYLFINYSFYITINLLPLPSLLIPTHISPNNWHTCACVKLETYFRDWFVNIYLLYHGCSNQLNLEMAAEFLTKNVSYLNLNISRTKNGRNKL